MSAFIEKSISYDIIRLLGSHKVAKGKHRKILPLYKAKKNKSDDKTFHLARLLTTPGGVHATLISLEGAKKLLRATEKFAFPIDTILGRTWETGLESYSIQPGLAVQDLSFESTIGEEHHEKTIHLTGLEKLKFKLTRSLFKLEEALGKRYMYWSRACKDTKTATAVSFRKERS